MQSISVPACAVVVFCSRLFIVASIIVQSVTCHPPLSLLSLPPLAQAGTPVKDVELPDNPARKTLLLDKHADYIEAFERDKDDFVCTMDCFSLVEKGKRPHALTHAHRTIVLWSSSVLVGSTGD